MSLPASVIDPEVGVSRPATIRSVVVLPQPDGPRRAKNEPFGMSRSSSRTAVNAPNDFVTPRSRSPSYVAPSAVGDAVSTTCDIGPVSFVLRGLLVVERHEVEGVRQHRVVGEDQLVRGEVGVDLLHLLARSLDGADVVDPGREPGGDLGLVVVVDPLLGVRLVGREVGDHHVVAPERQALLGRDELDVRVVELELDHVTGPGLAGEDVPGREVLGVVVAGERADLTGVDDLLEPVDRRAPLRVGELVGVGPGHLQHERHRVPHLREQRDAALEVLAGQQLLEALDLLGLLGVVRDAGQTALPRRVVGQVGVPLPVADLGVELGVVVDVVEVAHVDARALHERLHRRLRPAVVGLVDVLRPVRDDQPLLRGRQVRGPARRRVLDGALRGEERQLQRGETDAGEGDSSSGLEQASARQTAAAPCGSLRHPDSLRTQAPTLRIVPRAGTIDKRSSRFETRTQRNPSWIARLSSMSKRSGGTGASLDEVSKAIIEQLQQDGRRSYAAIGKEVGLSEAAVRQRVQRLIEAGVMQVVAVTDPIELGFARQAMVGIRVSGPVDVVADRLAELDEADVVVVGAGYTGLWTAYYLAEADPELRIVVVEAETAGFGASGRNGGWCSALFPASLDTLARYADPAGARAQHRAMRATVDEVLRVADVEGIDAHAAKGGTIALARSRAQWSRARAEVAHARSWGRGDDDVRLLGRSEATEVLRGTATRGATYTPDCAAIHPARLVRGLADAVERRGVTIHEGTRVTSIEPRLVRTERGDVRARTIVRATEGYTASLRGQRRALVPLYSLIIATEPLPPETWAGIGLARRETF